TGLSSDAIVDSPVTSVRPQLGNRSDLARGLVHVGVSERGQEPCGLLLSHALLALHPFRERRLPDLPLNLESKVLLLLLQRLQGGSGECNDGVSLVQA